MEIDRSHCFICDKLLLSYDYNIRTVLTSFSSTPIVNLLEKLLDEKIENPEQCCCNECVKKLNDYDLASLTALNLEADLLEMYRRKHITYYVEEDLPIKPDLHENDEIEMLVEYDEEGAEEIEEISVHEPKVEDLEVEYVYDEEEDNEANEEILDTTEVKKQRERSPRTKKHIKSITTTIDEIVKVDKLLQCKECNMEFDTKTEKTKHLKTHKKKNNFVCDMCGQTYKSKTALDIHVGMHNGTSPHECEVCGKKFTQKGALVRHMPLHTGERPYQCDKCGKQFIHYSSFHMHQLAHYDIRLKKCEICGLELRSNSHLTRHLRVHSGEKPYACPQCGQKFAQRYNMMTHYKSHQGIHRVQTKNRKCVICGESFNKQAKLDQHIASVHSSDAAITTDEASSNELVVKLETVDVVKEDPKAMRLKTATTTYEYIEIN